MSRMSFRRSCSLKAVRAQWNPVRMKSMRRDKHLGPRPEAIHRETVQAYLGPSGLLDADLPAFELLENGVACTVDEDGDEDDGADHERIDVGVGVDHHEAVLDRLDEHGAEHRSD